MAATQAMATDNKAPGFVNHPDHRVDLAREGRRVTVRFGGEAIADSERAITVREGRYDPVFYFPREDVRMERLSATRHSTHCPFKGDASYWSIRVGDRTAENAVWSYERPYDETRRLAGLVAFYADRVDSITVEPASPR